MSEKSAPIRILHLEDSAIDAALIQDLLEAEGGTYEFIRAGNRREFEDALEHAGFDIILCDYSLPDCDGASALRLARERHPDTPLIIVSGAIDAEEAVACLKAGAIDYLLKERLERLTSAIERALEEAAGKRQRLEARSRLRESEARYRSVAENLGDGLVLTDTDDIILDVNPRLIELTGYARDELVGRDGHELFMNASQVEEMSGHNADRAAGRSDNYEIQVRRKDGYQFAAEVTGAPLRKSKGEIFGTVGVVRDITGRKRAEEALRASEQMFQAAMQHAPIGMALVAPDGRWLKVNQALCRIVGYSEEEMLASTFQAITHPEDLEADLDCVRRMLSGEIATYQMEKRYLHKNRHTVWILLNVTLLKDERGAPAHFISQIQDITARMQVQAQLEESNEMFRSLASVAPVGIFRMDAQGLCTYVNRHWCVMTGFSLEQALGAGWTFTIHREDRARVFQEWNLTVGQGHPFRTECRIQKPDGTVIWGIATTVELRSGDGCVIGYVGTVFNITEQKQTEAVLRTLSTEAAGLTDEAFFRFVARRLAETLDLEFAFVGRLDGERHGHIRTLAFWADAQFAANTLYNLEGTPCEKVVGKDLCIYPSDVQQDFPLDTMLVEMGIVSYAGIPLHTASGRSLGLLCVMSRHPLRDPKQIGAILNLFAVRTAAEIERAQAMAALESSARELQQAKTELEEERSQLARRVAERTADLSAVNADLARANRLKGEFMANMSHELRTPLNAVLGLSESLLEQRSGPLTERQVRAVRTIESSGAHLLGLINDILDVSKVEAGKLEMQVGDVNVRAICEAGLQLVQQQAMGKRLDVQFTCEMDARPLHADARRLKQILVNLLSNAVKFTPQGGKIGLEVRGDAAANRLAFTVWDTGIGIAPEDQERLFQPFVQLQTSLSREYEGTGLGLQLVQRLAEIHGGSVTLESEPGLGSRFTVRLPWSHDHLIVHDKLTSGSPPPAPAKPISAVRSAGAVPAAPTGPCILLAEDNETNIQTIGDYLMDHGFRVVVARDGREAIEQVRTVQPVLILMDIQMPVMDGIEAIRHIRADPELARMPIIALTALAMPGDREHCIAAGADDYLSKPVSLRELTQHVRQHLKVPGPA